jgi:hypothetical protein
MHVAMPRSFSILLVSLVLLFSCRSKDSSALSDSQYSLVQDSVRQMAGQIAVDVSRDGPIAWLRHFADTSGFFMASDGQLMFPSYDSASIFVSTKLIKMISKIELSWVDVRIDPLSTKLAVIGASFKEMITDSAGHQQPFSGYFTAVAQQTSQGWQLRNAHWSSLVEKRNF